MRPRGARWRWGGWLLRWGGVAGAIVFAAALAMSMWRGVAYTHPRGVVTLYKGGVVLQVGHPRPPRITKPNPMLFRPTGRGAGGWRPAWKPEYGEFSGVAWYALVPLWMPLAMVAVPSGAAWWRWERARRRARVGRCRCGYDLEGIVSGVCPECGAGVPARDR